MKYLSPDAAKAVACALVTRHLDYCNSLLYNLPDRDIERLQRVQNYLAHVVCKASRFSRSKPLLNFLHWLPPPVKYRMRFKLCAITFKALLFHQPTYLFNYLVPLQNSRLLRFSNTNMLTVPRYRSNWRSRAFAVAAPSTRNSLPVNFSTASTVTFLKKMLKTFLFDSASPHPPPPDFSQNRRPVDDISFDSQHWADFYLDSAPLSSYLWGLRRYRSYRINWIYITQLKYEVTS